MLVRNPADEQWWFEQNEAAQTRLRQMKWAREDVPALKAEAAKYPPRTAFIFGTGPSIEEVTPSQWTALSCFWSVGLNKFPYWLQKTHQRFDVPKLCMVMDRKMTGPIALQIAEGMSRCEAKTLASTTAFAWVHEYDGIVFGSPTWDMEYGLAITPTPKVRFNRCVAPAAHLCALLGFDVYLVGIDHGPCYTPRPNMIQETERANLALKHYQEDFLDQRGLKLYQCGKRSSITTVPYRDLNEVLDHALTNLCATA